MLSEALRRLSPDSVQRRFLTPKRSFSRTELRYLTEVDGRDHVALVAEYPAEPVRRLIAVARFVRLADDPEAAEVAITVADNWQQRGLGSLLSAQLAAQARSLGIRRFTATMAADNVPAHRLMSKLTDHLEQHYAGAGVDELVLDLAA
jgi:RimJ/RimL family protein N-acetyltransferase